MAQQYSTEEYSTEELASDRRLWDEYIDPTGEGRGKFETMTVREKMQMIVELFPLDVPDWDEDGQAILAQIRKRS